jgi:hypothetical protein
MSTSTAPPTQRRSYGAYRRLPAGDASAAATTGRQLVWLGVGIVVSFVVPFVLADQLGIQRDLYYGLYAIATVGLCAAWMADTHQSLRELIAHRWRWALGLGVVFAAISAIIVLTSEDATSHPEGPEFIGAILWRGVVYGATDGLLLSAFPILVVSAAFAGSKLRSRRGGKAAVLALAMAASLLITATYHLGYSDFRSSKVRKPVTGDLVWSIPTLATLNPVGAPIAHAGMHVAAVTHSYETELFLPPH